MNIESLELRARRRRRCARRDGTTWNTRSYSVDVNGQDLTWRGTLARLGDAEARFALKFSGAGDIDRPTGRGRDRVRRRAAALAGELIDRGVANVRLNGETALVTGHIPSLGAFHHGDRHCRGSRSTTTRSS